MKYLKKFNESFDDEDDDIEGIKFDDEDDEDDDIEGIKFDDEDDDYYSMAYDKIDKMLPADPDLQAEFYEIIDSEEEITTKYNEMEEFFVINIDEDKFDSYCENGNLKNFAIYVVQRELNIKSNFDL